MLFCFAHCSLLSAFRHCTFGLWAFGLFGLLGISRCELPALLSCHLVCIGVVVCPWFSQFPIPSCLCFSRFFLFHFPWVRLDLYSVFCVLSFFSHQNLLFVLSTFLSFFLLLSAFVRLSSVGGWELSSFTASPLLVPLFLLDFECLFPSRTGFSTQRSGSSSIASIAAGFVCV